MAKRKPKASDPNGPHVRTLAELARVLGVGKNTPTRWKKHAGFPVNKDGTYPAGRIARWVEAMRSRSANRSPDAAVQNALNVGTAANGQTSKVQQDLSEELLRSRRNTNRRLELDLAERLTNLISREQIEAEWGQRALELKRALEVLGRRLAPDDKELRARIDEETTLMLEAYSRPLQSTKKKRRRREVATA